MKFRMKVKNDGSPEGWWEDDYTARGGIEEARATAKGIIDKFNETCRPGELKRTLVDVEVTEPDSGPGEPLKDGDLCAMRVYRGKRPRVGLYVEDRQIVWRSRSEIQYDGPAVKEGKRLPKVTIEEFLKWASHDVTDQLPKEGWATSL